MLQHQIVIRFLNRYYAMVHFPATVAFIVVGYVKAPEVYARIRLVFISVTAVALVTQIAYPLAPPRMMPGFIDTIARYGPAIYTRPGVESVANQYAAMPSLHVGWAVIIAYGMLQLTGRPWRWIGVVHTAITTVAVVGTANHYWVDGLVAFGLVAGGDPRRRSTLADSPSGARRPRRGRACRRSVRGSVRAMIDEADRRWVDSMPAAYDRWLVPDGVPALRDRPRRPAAAEVPPGRVLELAAGTGAVTRALLDALPAQTSLPPTSTTPWSRWERTGPRRRAGARPTHPTCRSTTARSISSPASSA